MYIISFADLFPAEGAAEIRTLSITNHVRIPSGSYSLHELFCTDCTCECSKVDILVVNSEGNHFARISIGWRTKQYYDDFFGFVRHKLPDPSLPPFTAQGPYAGDFLQIIRDLWFDDAAYRAMIKRHYIIMKVNGDAILYAMSPRMQRNPLRAHGRNDPCCCGSGRKYKRCCLGISTEAEL